MLRNLGYLGLSAGLVSSGVLGYLQLKCYLNRRNYAKEQTSTETKDTTRPEYDYFGLNWGAKADMMIMDELDTGDLLFFNLDCSECLQLGEMVRCYSKKLLNDVNTGYEGFGIAVRHGTQVSVIYERNGELHSVWYPEFLSSPFLSELVMRKFHVETGDKEFSKLFAKRVMILDHQVKNKDQLLQK